MTETQQPAAEATPATPAKINHVALWAMITGATGLTFGWMIPGPWSLAAVILGHIGLRQTKGTKGSNRGFAIAGIVTGYVGIAIALFFIAAIIIAISVLGIDQVIYMIQHEGFDSYDFENMPGMMNP
jgi:hypothetical protein